MKQPISIYDGTMTEEDLEPVLATQEQDGLMSKEDKKKLDSMSEGGGGSTPIESIDASKVVQDETHRFVTDTEKTTWNSKAGTDKVTGAVDGLMAKEDKVKLDAIEAEANKYVHPANHPATMITEDTDHKFVTETQIASWDAKATGEVATGSKDGLMSKEDKTKLDTVEEGANKYVHPANHEASMIIEDETHRFVTDTEKTTWNTPATKDTVGLGNVTNDAQVKRSEMGVADGVATLDSTGKVPASQLPSFVDDVIEVNDFESLPEEGEAGKIYVTTTDNKSYRWAGSSYVEIPTSVALGETESTAYPGNKGKANADEIAKIKDGTTVVPKAGDAATVSGHTVEVNVPTDAKFTDTVYTHPDTHDATIINQDATHKFVTDTQISTWDAKAETTVVTTEANGLMSKEDKTKLDGIATGANNYTHPENHPATMITEDTDHRFVTDTEKAAWNGKADVIVATTEKDGLMASTDKTKLDGIEVNANKYEHPANHPATMITEDDTHKFVTTTQISTWDGKASTDLAEAGKNGLMSKEDKTKLDGIADGANNYVHPDDENTRHVTDTEKATWNAKADTTAVTTKSNGLMSKEDKTKLDTVEEGANKYTHPANHPATMITEDTDHRFVTDTEKSTWNNKASTEVATIEANGLMSKEDKTKLDGIVNVPSNFELVRQGNYLNLSFGNPKELKAKFYLPKAQFAGNQCFVADELASFYGDLGGNPVSYNMKQWESAGVTVEELTAENGPYLVLSTMNLGEETGEESEILLEQHVTSLKPYFEDYIKSAEFTTKEFPELQTTAKTIVGAINELKAALDELKGQ